ncbi:MAG: 2-dehydropantoate 2-reductase [Candidatus Thorarchaeota archaeon]|nr:MAG: 2-dehydropantoate 2-reductase [Candidatus Thorarchaeota archaeon]
MRIVIMGSGAIGGLYGGLLSHAGEDVHLLVGRAPNVDAINTRGLRIKGVLGEHILRLRATQNAEEIDEADLVLITTKAYDSEEAAKRIKHLTDNGAYILILQNGIGTEKKVAEILGTRRVLRATTCMGAIMSGPGEVTVTGCGITEIGSHYPENMDMVEKVVFILRNAGFDVRSSDNIEGVVWTKTIVNCGINPIGALTGMTNGEIYNDTRLRSLVVKLVQEAVDVAKAIGVSLTADDPIRYALGTAKATGDNINSMLKDIQMCKQTEIDAITGEVVRLAREHGIETPYSDSVYALVKALESKVVELDVDGPKVTPLSVEEVERAISNA